MSKLSVPFPSYIFDRSLSASPANIRSYIITPPAGKLTAADFAFFRLHFYSLKGCRLIPRRPGAVN